MKTYSRKKPWRPTPGTLRKGGSRQLTVGLEDADIERVRRIAVRNELSLSAAMRELTKTGLKLAETGNPWRGL